MTRSQITPGGHTPGPWITERQCAYALNSQGENRFYAQVQVGRADNGERTSLEELTANARLIAAAPDLLAACEAVRVFTQSDRAVWHKVRDAIKKARGE